MKYKPTRAILFALAAALCVLLAAWLLPLPRIIAGEEELAAKRLPQTRASVMSTQQSYKPAQERYQAYVKTHDLSALHESAKQAIAKARTAPDDQTNNRYILSLTKEIVEYARELQSYAQASEKYFAALRSYDDDLMSWTRSLGAQSELLRSATFPFVEYLKRYPPPVGLATDPPEVTASTVSSQIAALEKHGIDLNSIDNIWASGRSIEYIAGLHDEYYADLHTYDTKVEQVANASNQPQQSTTRRLFATSLDILLGVVTLGGLGALFLARKGTQR